MYSILWALVHRQFTSIKTRCLWLQHYMSPSLLCTSLCYTHHFTVRLNCWTGDRSATKVNSLACSFRHFWRRFQNIEWRDLSENTQKIQLNRYCLTMLMLPIYFQAQSSVVRLLQNSSRVRRVSTFQDFKNLFLFEGLPLIYRQVEITVAGA